MRLRDRRSARVAGAAAALLAGVAALAVAVASAAAAPPAATLPTADVDPAPADADPAPAERAPLIGTRAPSWEGLRWIHGGPLTLEALRGRPVLLRFFTDGCSLCRASAPTLRTLWKQFGERGLMIVAIHHPKRPESRAPEVVARTARELGFVFPVAMDPDWRTVRAYGVGSAFRRYTSVSLLVDGEGVIRWVHDGGELVPGSPEARALEATIARLLPRR